MSESTVESERPGAEEDNFGDLVAPEDEQNVREPAEEDEDGDHRPDIVEMLREERDEGTPKETQNGYRNALRETDGGSDSSSLPPAPGNARSPAGSVMSAQGSLLSSPGSSVLPSLASRPGIGSPTPSFRPFDRRFTSRLSVSSVLNSPRPSSPAFLTSHSRHASITSNLMLDSEETDTPSPPWEVIRWTKLKKLNGQAFSELGRRNFGTPTCIAVSASIAVGTTKGIILIFDYQQNLKSIIGPGTKAVESGSITSIAISADHTTVAGGHAEGHIFTWELARSARPFLHIPPLDRSQLESRNADGHVSGTAVTHLGFLGTRHTALVSADKRGMAFSHLATRGMGAVGLRSVKTTRILGRYPYDVAPAGKRRGPSSVLAFAPLPLGNVERGTDTLGLTAMLTPYLLVIVSTTPVAQTQHKAPRPKEVEAHSAMSGCLAWFPAVKLKVKDPDTGSQISKVKLAYCWSNVLTVLDIDEVASSDRDRPPSVYFKPRSRWKAEEAIVAVQWISRSVLAVLTITQRLIILEDQSMRMTEGFDLVQKHIFHVDLFSEQLHSVVEQLDEEDPSLHGVVADAFYMSFKTYKGRMFLLGFNDMSVGSLSNWADRLIALMENGDYVGSIHLATSYYIGEADKLTVGLPEDASLRHSMVRDKLVEIMTSSLKFAFKSTQTRDDSRDENLKALAEACFTACLNMDDIDLLFDEVWEWYEDGDAEAAFLETLEPYVLSETITMIPPTVIKSLVMTYVEKGLESRLEEMICHINTATLDIDQVTTLCKQHNLYDALIYVWNQALHDYITPLIELLNLLIPLVQNGDYFANDDVLNDPIFGVNALKMFPYMSYTFTGRVYPTRESMDDEEAHKAKAELYWFLFSGKTITWPRGSNKPFLTNPTEPHQPSFPYLRMILKFDAPSFLSSLNEAFEDSFLNDTPDRAVNGGSKRDLPEEQVFGLSVDRQLVVIILLSIMNVNDFAPEDTIYLDMFIARNYPKFRQYLLLEETQLNQVLMGLCNYPGDDIADDAQLSAEYLLSVYHPPDLSSLIPLFRQASFFRVLKTIYRTDKQYAKLLETYFEDPDDRMAVFGCIASCLRPRAGLTKRQLQEVHQVIETHALDLSELDTVRTAQTIEQYAPSLHPHFFDALTLRPHLQYVYLRTILEPEQAESDSAKKPPNRTFVERYVQLMCEYNASHVADYITIVPTADLRLETVLPAMEESGVVDAAVVLMSRDGQIRQAMDRLLEHISTLEMTLLSLLNAESDNTDDTPHKEAAAENVLEALQKYTNVGIWLCQSQTEAHIRRASSARRKSSTNGLANSELSPAELLWLDFIDAIVLVTKSVSASLSSMSEHSAAPEPSSRDGDEPSTPKTISSSHKQQKSLDPNELILPLRTLVQRTFSALLATTTSPSSPIPSTPTLSSSSSMLSSHTFLHILRAFLHRAAQSSPTLSDLRAVLASIFSTYAYEESILGIANRLLDKDLYVDVKDASERRMRGWRPRGGVCEGCGRRVWGPGVQGDVWGAWEKREKQKRREREEKGKEGERGKGRARAATLEMDGAGGEASGSGSGSLVRAARKISIVGGSVEEEGSGEDAEDAKSLMQKVGREKVKLEPLVVLACRHVYHQSCLEGLQLDETEGEMVGEGGLRCPVHG